MVASPAAPQEAAARVLEKREAQPASGKGVASPSTSEKGSGKCSSPPASDKAAKGTSKGKRVSPPASEKGSTKAKGKGKKASTEEASGPKGPPPPTPFNQPAARPGGPPPPTAAGFRSPASSTDKGSSPAAKGSKGEHSNPPASEKGSKGKRSNPPASEKGPEGKHSNRAKKGSKNARSKPPASEKGSEGKRSNPPASEKGPKGKPSNPPASEKGPKGKPSNPPASEKDSKIKPASEKAGEVVPDASMGPVHKNRGDSLAQWESFHKVWRHNIKDMFDEEMDAAAQPDLFIDPLVVLPKTTQGRLGEIFDQHPWLGVNRVRNITNHPVMFPLFEVAPGPLPGREAVWGEASEAHQAALRVLARDDGR